MKKVKCDHAATCPRPCRDHGRPHERNATESCRSSRCAAVNNQYCRCVEAPMTTVSRKQVGPFTLVRFPTLGKVDIRVDCEGGPMPLREFEKEVCPWDELGEGMEERVRAFYAANF